MWAKAAKSYDFKHIPTVTCEFEYRKGPDSLSGGRQLDHRFISAILYKHHQYLAKQVWFELKKKADNSLISYVEMENKITRYAYGYQLAEWLLPYAFAEGEWYRSYNLITNMVRSQPKKALFMPLQLKSKISIIKQFVLLFSIFLILVGLTIKHLIKKGLRLNKSGG